jgi:hypothetical protein
VGKVTYWDNLYVLTNCLGDIIKKNDMGGACSTCGEEERRIQDLGGET